MIAWLVAAGVLAGILVPHVTDLRRVTPGTAAALWVSALGLRAAVGLFAAIYFVLYFPATGIFQAVTHWCWHAILPLIAAHLGLNGHRFGDALTALPAMLLVVSALSIAYGLVRASRVVRRLVRRDSLGPGPRGSLILPQQSIVLAAAGLSRPRVVVSVGALKVLDDEELAAGLDHEHGHIARGHRWILLYAEACRALGRFLPWTRRAVRELAFHLERDADLWALARRHDRLALSGAICKATLHDGSVQPAISSLAGQGDVERRVDDLVGGGPALSASRTRALRVLATAFATLALALAVSVPATVAAGMSSLGASAMPEHCAA